MQRQQTAIGLVHDLKNRYQMYFSFFNAEAAGCLRLENRRHRTACLNKIDLREECSKSNVRLVKTIRARLDVVSPLLEDKSMDLKIIHLYRDPRGFLSSIDRFQDFSHNITMYCSNVEHDLKAYFEFKSKFPDKIIQVSYEELASNVLEETKDLFQIVYNASELSSRTLSYLDSHTRHTLQGVMSRVQDTAHVYQGWRRKISPTLLKQIQSNVHCRTIIQRMGHRMFASLGQARDLSIPIFL